MSDVTRLLDAAAAGDPKAAAELLPLVYDELRKLAAARLADEKPGQTLQPTALVHEAYLRLVGATRADRWNGRGHFFAAAAEAMRRILVESRPPQAPPHARGATGSGSTWTAPDGRRPGAGRRPARPGRGPRPARPPPTRRRPSWSSSGTSPG